MLRLVPWSAIAMLLATGCGGKAPHPASSEGVEAVNKAEAVSKAEREKAAEGFRQARGVLIEDGAYFRGLPNFTDADLAPIRFFPELKYLEIHKCPISDAGLVHLRGLTELRKLELRETRITDAGLVHLEGLTKTKLGGINLYGTTVTLEGARRLKQKLPGTIIQIDGHPLGVK